MHTLNMHTVMWTKIKWVHTAELQGHTKIFVPCVESGSDEKLNEKCIDRKSEAINERDKSAS